MNTSLFLRRQNIDNLILIDAISLNAAITECLQHSHPCGIRFDLMVPERLNYYFNNLLEEEPAENTVTGRWFYMKSAGMARKLVARQNVLLRQPVGPEILMRIMQAAQAAIRNAVMVNTWTVKTMAGINRQKIVVKEVLAEMPDWFPDSRF